MLQAMIEALEPQARGRKRSEDAERRQLEEDNARLRREASRLQALYRSTQRAVGIKALPKPSSKGKAKTGKVRRTRKQSRGERVLQALRGQLSESPTASATMSVNTAEA